MVGKFSFSFVLGLTLLAFSIVAVSGKVNKLIVNTDSPAVADAPISLQAIIKNPDKENYKIVWAESFRGRWFEDTHPNRENNFTSNWTLIYYSSDLVYGPLPVTVSLYHKQFYWWDPLDSKQLFVTVTRNFTGSLDVWQDGQVIQAPAEGSPILISRKNETTLKANFHDPSGFLKTADTLTYEWRNSSGVIANATGEFLKLNFTQDGDYYFNVTLTAVFNATSNSSNTKSGTLEVNVTAKAPVSNLTVSGLLWFAHGKLLNLNVTCDGSPPFRYCWWIQPGPYNQTGNETCTDLEMSSNTCEFAVANRYFSKPNGTFTLLILVYNDVSRVVNQSMIHVYLVHQKQPLSIIVVPVTCSLVAIILIIFGIAYYVDHQKKYNVEVANFDFGEDTESTYVTFIERLSTVMSARTNVPNQPLINTDDDGPSSSTLPVGD